MSELIIMRPTPEEYPEWFAAEIELVETDHLLEGLRNSFHTTFKLLSSLSMAELSFRYAEGKWTIKEMWQHMLDVERILAYRALRYARKDATVLSGFDEKNYVEVSTANERDWTDILEEYKLLRQSSIVLIKSFTAEMLDAKGTAGRSTLSVRAVCHLMLGHELHHVNTIKTRYLKS